MNILYTCDDNYTWIMGISMISLFENNKDVEEINIYLLGDNISIENKNKLNDISKKYKRKLFIIDVPSLDIPEVLYSQRWPASAYTRLFSGKLLPEKVKKIIYIDCDTIILSNIHKLWSSDVSEYVFIGVKDCIGKLYKENIGLESNSPYINAGVLLINLEKLRNIDISSKINSYLNKYIRYINYSDQDILNGIFEKKIGFIEPKYNFMTLLSEYNYEEVMKLRNPTNYYTSEQLYIAKNNPCIIHYTTCMLVIRPWFLNTNHLLANEFEKYKLMSPWKNIKYDNYIFSSTESKVIKIIFKAPRVIAIRCLGIMHGIFKPISIRIKEKIRRGNL